MIDYEVIKNCDFPVLKVNNFLDEKKLSDIKDEIRLISKDATHFELGIREHERVFVDNYYDGRRDESSMLRHVSEKLFSDGMYDVYNSIPDTAFHLIRSSTYHETQLTFYKNTNQYEWHGDNINKRICNWILYVDVDSDFTGGENQISNSVWDEESMSTVHNVDISTKPKDNLLLIMPSWVTHSVAPVFMKSNDLLKGRITVNGHIGFRT
jgi:Rps23 Pro-64 3,4-dihydroxylase Tpa1-like proline 4-hydroxylase